jgi:hypothetical protein
MAGANALGGWRWPLAAFYVGVLFAKSLVLVATLYRGVVAADAGDAARRSSRALGRALFLAALLPYGFLAPYVVTAVSAGGDEPLYLLNTASLAADGDMHMRNNVEQRAYASFFWGRPSPGAWTPEFVGLPLLLLPGYALGTSLFPHYPLAARLGATLTIALGAALLGVQVYRLCRDLGASRPAAFWAWLLVALTPPVLVHSGHVYPELPAALAAVVGVRALRQIPERTWVGLAVVGGAVGGLVLLKDRYTSLALGLCLWALARLATGRPRLALTLLGGLVAAGVVVVWANPVPLVFPNLGSPGKLGDIWLSWHPDMARAVVGMLVDQEYGLLVHAPHWLLVVVGVPLLWRRRRAAAAGLLGLFLFYVLVLVKYRWARWHGGWTPPPRLLLAGVPLLAPFLAEVFDRCRGRTLAVANTVWLVWGGVLAFVVSLVPAWRYQHLRGRSALIERAGTLLDVDLARFLPSLSAPTAWTWTVLSLGAFVLAGVVLVARRERPPTHGWGRGTVWLAPRPAVRLVVALGLAWIALAHLLPSWSVEGEAMRHSGGTQFVSFDDQTSVWLMTADGELSEPVVTWPGVTEIRVLAGAMTTTGEAPRIALLLDNRLVAAWTLRAGSGTWVGGEYLAQVSTTFGHSRLRLRLDGLAGDPGTGRFQHAYVDRVVLRRLGT